LGAQAVIIGTVAAVLLAVAVFAGMPYQVVDPVAYLFCGSIALLMAIGLGIVASYCYTRAHQWIERRRQASPLAFARGANVLHRARDILLQLPVLVVALPFYGGKWSTRLHPVPKLAVQAMVIGYVAALLLVIAVLTRLPYPLIDLLTSLVCGSIAVGIAMGLSVAAHRCYRRASGRIDSH
jgi:hypothetical protein